MKLSRNVLPSSSVEPSRFVLFRRGKILTGRDGGILHASGVAGADESRAIHVGDLDGRACYAQGIDEEPPGCAFVPLRAAFILLPEDLFSVAATAAQLLTWDAGHRFCARCAAPLASVAGERARRCEPCAVDYYPRLSPAVIVLVHDGRRALLTHKAPAPFFALVAGFVEAGEALEETVVREVREETGVEVDEITYFGSQPWPFPHQVMIGFFARFVRGEIVLDGKELDDAKWFDVDALPTVPPNGSIAGKMIEAWRTRQRPA